MDRDFTMHQHEKLNYVEFGSTNINATKQFLSVPLTGPLSIMVLNTLHFQDKG